MILKDNKPYEYRLTYIDGEHEITHVFSGFVNGKEMQDYLKDFLLACSWTPESANLILGRREDV